MVFAWIKLRPEGFEQQNHGRHQEEVGDERHKQRPGNQLAKHHLRYHVEQMQLTDEVREYVGVPATFSFGMARFRAVSAVGGKSYMPPRGFDPLELARYL